MSADQKKKCDPAQSVRDCGTACSDCLNSKTKEEWAKLTFAYVVFYLFMTGWMAVHITGLLATTPELEAFEGTPSYAGEKVFIGEPIFNGFLNYVATTGNRPLTVDPWNQNTMRLYEQTVSDDACGSPNADSACRLSQQVRLNNHWGIRVLPRAVTIQCSPDGSANLTFTNCSNPWGNETGTSAATCEAVANSLTVHFPNDHVLPHIMQFDVYPTNAVGDQESSEVTVSCTISTEQISEEGDVISYGNFLAQKYTFENP